MTGRELEFFTLDVFTDQVFGGNPLAVVMDADHLADDQMQRIAREFNLSETVFVRAAGRQDVAVDLRIFTPSEELPFAGHPTVGTAALLVDLGLVPASADGTAAFRVGEGVGPVTVRVHRDSDGLLFAWLTAARPVSTEPAPPAAALAEVLGLEPAAVGDDTLGTVQASAGTPFTLVALRDLDALARARIQPAAYDRVVAGGPAPHLYLVVRTDAEHLRARMFGPAMGLFEDPATGAAATALGGYLAGLDPRQDGTLRWTVDQGVEMGRPSRIHVEAEKAGGAVTAVHVGGTSVRVTRGTLTLPGSERPNSSA